MSEHLRWQSFDIHFSMLGTLASPLHLFSLKTFTSVGTSAKHFDLLQKEADQKLDFALAFWTGHSGKQTHKAAERIVERSAKDSLGDSSFKAASDAAESAVAEEFVNSHAVP